MYGVVMSEYAGRGDPARTMELLWGEGPTPRRGPRQRLRLEKIVERAVARADAGGLDAVTMRGLAEELGVGTMTLYTYVPGRGELLEIMVDRVAGEQPLPSAARGWRAGLEQYGRGAWSLYNRHPWLLQVATSRTVLGPHTIALFDAALAVLAETGLRGKQAVAVVSLMDGFTRGTARGAVEAAQAPARTGETDDEWWMKRAPILDRQLEAAMAAGRLRALAAAAADGAFDQPPGGASYTLQRAVEEFEFGLERVLDGVEAFMARRPRRGRTSRRRSP
jgi:AcrR family transcriptional regulator